MRLRNNSSRRSHNATLVLQSFLRSWKPFQRHSPFSFESGKRDGFPASLAVRSNTLQARRDSTEREPRRPTCWSLQGDSMGPTLL